MKKFEIVICGEHEEAIGHKILKGIYEAVQENGYTDVSVKADTVKDLNRGELQMPEFLKSYRRGNLEQHMMDAGR